MQKMILRLNQVKWRQCPVWCPERVTCPARSGAGTSDYTPQLEKVMMCVLGEIRFVGAVASACTHSMDVTSGRAPVLVLWNSTSPVAQ